MENFKTAIFEGPQIRKLVKDSMSKAEQSAWQSLKSVITNFLRNRRSAEYEKEIKELPEKFLLTRTRMFVRLHILRSHFDYFANNLWRSEWRAGCALSLRRSHYGTALPRPVGCKRSHWLLLVLETSAVAAGDTGWSPWKDFSSMNTFCGVLFGILCLIVSFLRIYQP